MNGKIPDARNVIFNIWRDYEEIYISDVSLYLRLNHSRLITSKFKWRPEIKTEIMVYFILLFYKLIFLCILCLQFFCKICKVTTVKSGVACEYAGQSLHRDPVANAVTTVGVWELCPIVTTIEMRSKYHCNGSGNYLCHHCDGVGNFRHCVNLLQVLWLLLVVSHL
jgi:hypothetical protein